MRPPDAARAFFKEPIMNRQRWAITGVIVGWLVVAAGSRADEAEAKKAMEKLGGKITVHPIKAGNPVRILDLSQTKVTDADLNQLKEFKSLQSLRLTDTAVTDAGLKELKDL